jgi:diguanylate cyclase (GGDEF)-like protein
VPVTISVGVVTAPPGLRDAESFLATADALLYEAKRQGRNRVAC